MIEKKAELVKRLLIRYINDNGLKTGEKLPNQNVLRSKLDCGAAPLTQAISDLNTMGILKSCGKIGVFVTKKSTRGVPDRQIGVITMDIDGVPTLALINNYIGDFLFRNGCKARWFQCDQASKSKIYYDDSDIDGLTWCITSKQLDGIITNVWLSANLEKLCEKYKIPILYLGNYVQNRNHVCFDYHYIIAESVDRLYKAGYKHLAFCAYNRFCGLEETFLQVVGQYPAIQGEIAVYHFPRRLKERTEWLMNLLKRWQDMPSASRPDALVVLDDILAQWIAMNLFVRGDWLPEVIVMRNQDIDLPVYPTKIGYWSLHLKEYATFAGEKFLHLLRSQTLFMDFAAFRPDFIPTPKDKS